MSTPEPPATAGAAEHRTKSKRLSKRSLMAIAGTAAAVGFALPWATIQALPRSVLPADRQVIVVPAGDQFVVGSATTTKGAGASVGTAASAPAVATTRASAPAPPGA